MGNIVYKNYIATITTMITGILLTIMMSTVLQFNSTTTKTIVIFIQLILTAISALGFIVKEDKAFTIFINVALAISGCVSMFSSLILFRDSYLDLNTMIGLFMFIFGIGCFNIIFSTIRSTILVPENEDISNLKKESTRSVEKQDGLKITTEKSNSTGKIFILIAWWMQWIGIIGFFIYYRSLHNAAKDISYYSSYNTQEDRVWMSVILIGIIIMTVGQIINYIGIKYLQESKGWCIFYIVYGVLSLVTFSGLFYLIGGILSLSSMNNSNHSKNIPTIQESDKNILNEIQKLNDMKKNGLINDDEYQKAKDKFLKRI